MTNASIRQGPPPKITKTQGTGLMRLHALSMMALLVVSGCALFGQDVRPSGEGICDGLRSPLERHADALLALPEGDALIDVAVGTGGDVIEAYEAGCG